ncbi:MAG: FAD:protein FMN transferase [Acidobacteria bacterium]|nr:FAD:protein FMN transferase [Acidobacteriota bacterium]
MDVLARTSFSAMGNSVDVTVVGGGAHLLDAAAERIEQLESRWSRFRDGSDVARLNAAGGRPVPVHRDTVLLVQYLVAAQAATLGAFDPTLGPALARLGYRTSRTDSRRTSSFHDGALAGTDLSSTRIDRRFDEIVLPPAATLDPGGLGKGLAADLVATMLLHGGAEGACVSIGGDIRCTGRGPVDGHWTIGVADAFGRSRSAELLRLGDGGVATSSVFAKQWTMDGAPRHHVLDPDTAQPLPPGGGAVVQASAVAAEAVWAEVAATVALVRQSALAGALGGPGGAGRIAVRAVRADGAVEQSGDWMGFVHE